MHLSQGRVPGCSYLKRTRAVFYNFHLSSHQKASNLHVPSRPVPGPKPSSPLTHSSIHEPPTEQQPWENLSAKILGQDYLLNLGEQKLARKVWTCQGQRPKEALGAVWPSAQKSWCDLKKKSESEFFFKLLGQMNTNEFRVWKERLHNLSPHHKVSVKDRKQRVEGRKHLKRGGDQGKGTIIQ